ncbi:hypothetical protein Tco_0227331 [Tanacetum coccineum]
MIRDWMYFHRREEVSYEDDENEDMEDDLRLNNTATVGLGHLDGMPWHDERVTDHRVSFFAIQEKFPVLFSMKTDHDLAPEEDGSGEDESASVDPFLAVMNKEYNGHRRTFSRGVTNKLIKVNGSETSYVVLGELMESVKTAIDAELSRLVEMRKHIEDDHERKKLELAEEHKRKKAELEDMRKEIEDQRDRLVEDAVKKLIQKLPRRVVREFLT